MPFEITGRVLPCYRLEGVSDPNTTMAVVERSHVHINGSLLSRHAAVFTDKLSVTYSFLMDRSHQGCDTKLSTTSRQLMLGSHITSSAKVKKAWQACPPSSVRIRKRLG